MPLGMKGLALCGPRIPRRAHRRGCFLRDPRRRRRRRALLEAWIARSVQTQSGEALIMNGVVPRGKVHTIPSMNRAKVVNVTPWTMIWGPPVGAPVKVQGVSVRMGPARWTPMRPRASIEAAVRGAAGWAPRTLELMTRPSSRNK